MGIVLKNPRERQSQKSNSTKEKLTALNIMLLGSTGVGKSSFINHAANSLKYKSLKEAVKEGVLSPASVHFTVFNEKYEDVNISVGQQNEEDLTKKKCSVSTMKYKDTIINLIDTPPIHVDDVVPERNEENIKEMKEFAERNGTIHCYCVVLKSNESKLDSEFNILINQIMKHFGGEFSKFVFCFTHCRGTFFKPGHTLLLLNDLFQNSYADFEIDKNSLFSFDNESFRYLCTFENKGIKYEPDDVESFEESWNKFRQEFKRFIKFVIEIN